ncbi:MAG TPA: hypothetical protein VGD90_00695, partial [Sphingobacteriaceae bacterium]
MFTRKARLSVIFIGVILFAWTLYSQVYEISAVIAVGIGALIYGYFREGTVVMASREFHNKNYERA